VTVCSLFVNPTQFNDPADFEKYPKTIERDIDQLEETGCQVLFMPGVTEMYPRGFEQSTHYELGYLETILEGKFRPGHYQGVCLVVHKLMDIVRPDLLFLGQKDYQQCLVIKKLLEIIGMDQQVEVIICPTLREKNGLAMSSRNMRLSPEELKIAPAIFETLTWVKDHLNGNDTAELISGAIKMLESKGLKPEYLEIADADTLEQLQIPDGKEPVAILTAAWLGDVRLIDNIVVKSSISLQ
jgi:pantoate--beta-alanine ligase